MVASARLLAVDIKISRYVPDIFQISKLVWVILDYGSRIGVVFFRFGIFVWISCSVCPFSLTICSILNLEAPILTVFAAF